jgi:biopolymer transport protein ExbD
MHGPTDSEDGITGINVTPLVDIMLVLLIIFMIATRLDQPTAMDVQLPRAASATELQNGKQLAIVVHKDGSLHLNGRAVTLADLRAAAERADKEIVATVSGDEDVPYKRMAAVMDTLRLGGVYKLALPTQPEDAP